MPSALSIRIVPPCCPASDQDPSFAAICVKEIFSNQLTQKRRALPLGCPGRSLRSSDATEARQSDRARTKTRARPPICGLRRPVGVPNSPVSWRRKTPDTTKSDSRPSEPARLASSWPTRKAPRASRGPAGHQRRGAHHPQSRDGDNRDIRETHLNLIIIINLTNIRFHLNCAPQPYDALIGGYGNKMM